jgi:hypothetical protein
MTTASSAGVREGARRAPEVGVFEFATRNLGDEVQSFVAMSHVGRVHTFLTREQLPDFRSNAETHCVFNVWFLLGDDFRRPSSDLRPVWHGFTTFEEILSGEWIDYLKEHAPIGCRDLYVTEVLDRLGVECYWTGCLTLFAADVVPPPRRERRGVLFVDVPEAVERHLPREIVDRAVRMSTFPPPCMMNRSLNRWAATAHLLEALASAELVVTRRLHAALPAASYGTPVVAVPDPGISLARRRFQGFERVLPVVFLDEAEAGLGKIDWRNVPVASIPSELRQRYDGFRETLRKRGIAGATTGPRSSLDETGADVHEIENASRRTEPGRIRLSLGAQAFELPVVAWNDRRVRVGLRGFPGLSKFEFVVEACRAGGDDWAAWGRLRDLVVPERH